MWWWGGRKPLTSLGDEPGVASLVVLCWFPGAGSITRCVWVEGVWPGTS